MAVQRFKNANGQWEVIGGTSGGASGGVGMYELKLGANGDGSNLTTEELQSNANLYQLYKQGKLNAPIYIQFNGVILFALGIMEGQTINGYEVLVDFLLTSDSSEDNQLFGLRLNYILGEDGTISIL